MTLLEYIKKHYKLVSLLIFLALASLVSIYILDQKKEDNETNVMVFRSDEFKNAFFKAMYHIDYDDGREQGVWKYHSPSGSGIMILAFKGDSFRAIVKRVSDAANDKPILDIDGKYSLTGGALYFKNAQVSKIFNSQAVIVIPKDSGRIEVYCDGQPGLVFNKFKSF